MSDRLGDLTARIETLEAELGRLKSLAPSGPGDAALSSQEQADPEASASRRDLLRYGAVALGAAAAGMAASPVEAADGGPVLIGVSNTGASSTILTMTGSGYGFYVTATSAIYGLLGVASAIGTYGHTTGTNSSHAGVQGVSASSSGQAPGVYGLASSPNAPAVYGRNEAGGNAMRAEVPSNATTNAIAMYALNYSSYTGGGSGAGGFAIYGLSAKGHGLVGATAAAGAAAVVGATNGVAGAYAGAFYGPVVVGGNFTVVGGAKSAAVPHPDGSHRRLYCVESPESWFEDFGEAALVCGEASIALDPDFAAVVDTSRYHVFLTAYDSDSYLNVVDRAPGGFRVRANHAAEGTFSWRVVAKRKDIAGARLERVDHEGTDTARRSGVSLRAVAVGTGTSADGSATAPAESEAVVS
jgi:hypothetical protein